jgi:glutamate synthase domain-containing protein 2
MSKMGISTLRSYRSSQLFEAVGIHPDLIDKYFAGTISRIGGIGINDLAQDILIPHRKAFNIEHKNMSLLMALFI